MLSNLNSCHGVFIPSSLLTSQSSSMTRHYRPHSTIKVHETKRNKRAIHDESMWTKIEEDFMPELLEEQKMNIPEDVQCSPKQTSSNPSSELTTTPSLEETTIPPLKKMSALFIKPEMDVECLYRKSGIRENCEVCSSEVVLTDDGFLTCKNPACSILYKDESSRSKRRVAILWRR